jgi:two-component sensor histidine kinase
MLFGLLSAIFTQTFFVAVGIFTTFIFGLYSLCVALYCVRHKNRSAIFFVLGVSFGLMGTMITGLSVSAIIPSFNMHMYKAVDYGIVIDTILLSIALAKRYTVLFENLQAAQTELILLSSNLENIVEQRTKFLNRELENNKLLLKEIFHRVKNNLQIISSMLILQTKNVDNPMLFKTILEENIQRIHSISLMHEKIFRSKNISEINVKKYIKDIIFDFIDLTGSNTLSFNLNIKDISIGINNLIPIGLIINELLTNSIKYAFNANILQPHVTIELFTQDEYVYFKYKDNGEGACLDSFKEGFGLQLLDSLGVYQLHGKREYFNQEGFNYIIVFPKEKLNT